MQYGLEIEFRHPILRRELASSLGISISNTPDRWNLGTDASLNLPRAAYKPITKETVSRAIMNMLELRSPIFTELDDSLERILKEIKIEGDCSGCCGLHIHVSDPSLVGMDYKKFGRVLLSKYAKSVRDSRLPYCMAMGHEKYIPFREIDDDHYEVRIFNSSFNPVYIRQKINEVTKLLKDFLDSKQK
jgi:hypothetical protein